MKFRCIIMALLLMSSVSCETFLSMVPDKSLTIPTTVTDLEALLNNRGIFRYSTSLGDLSSDDWYCTYSLFQSLPIMVRNCYTWQDEIFEAGNSGDWNSSYYQIYYANIVLEKIKSIDDDSTSNSEISRLKGRAYFIRAFNYYKLSQLFIKPFDPLSARSDLGLPLRLHSDPNENIERSTVKQTYQQMIEDAIRAKNLLGTSILENKPNIPSKSAAFALLSKIYLSMSNYRMAGEYADSSLQLYPMLIDYNTIDSTKRVSFPRPSNKEVLYMAWKNSYFSPLKITVAPNLYRSYTNNDLRKSLFFALNENTGQRFFKGSYVGTFIFFGGLATDEMYLTLAECKARLGSIDDAMGVLNRLLEKRYRLGSFVKLEAVSKDDALKIILSERRKELVFRGTRWSDLRRLNKEPRFSKTLVRKLNGETYTLPPNDSRYTLPIPHDEILLGNIQQNSR